MENEKQTKMKKSTKYLLIGTLVLFLSIIGASVAYYLARVSGNLSGRAAGTELELTITPLSTSATDDLIPLDNDLETLNLAALGYGNEGSTFDSTKACIDINGYSVCQIYRIRVTNNGSVQLTMNGTVELSGANTPNIDCAKMDDEVTVTNNNSCMGTNTLANNVVLPANNHLDYYVMVYIKNLDEPQYDKGEFNGTVTFTTTDGKKVKGRFKRDKTLVEHITSLYNDAEKTVVSHDTICDNENSSSAGGISNKKEETKTKTMLLTSGGDSGDSGDFPALPNPTSPETNCTIDYNYATSINLMNDRLGGTTESLDGGNIRYYGANPNNYIDIGNGTYTDDLYMWQYEGASSLEECVNDWGESQEYCTTKLHSAGDPILWRIIGVFDGKVRIVSDESIGEYSWDTSASNINGGRGINEWSQADLMKLLNPGFESNTDFNTDGTTKIPVNNSLYWNSGSGTCYNGKSNATTLCDFTNSGLSDEAKEYVVDQTLYLGGIDTNKIYVNQAYVMERGNNVIQNPDDGIARTTRWTGKVGLIYPSDFGYAADLNSCHESLNLLTNEISCTDNNWLQLQWTITPSSLVADMTWIVSDLFHYSFTYSVHPVLTLSSDAYMISGTGTSDDPYVVG